MSSVGRVLGRLRNPEYTGENRCIPCTAVNTMIAIALAGAVWAVATAAGVPGIAPILGLATLAASLAAIALRGYLVPGTPQLTRRYFPAWLLAVFDKEPTGGAGGLQGDAEPDTSPGTEPPAEIDVEERLLEAGVVELCRGGEDLCLTEAFEAEWEAELAEIDWEAAGRDRLLEVLGVRDAEVSIEDHGDAFVVQNEGRRIGTWESRAAFRADLAAAAPVRTRMDDWAVLTVRQRGQLLHGVRLFVETCPECGGPVSMDVETVESCCRSHEVAAVTCGDCGVRLMETRPLPEDAIA